MLLLAVLATILYGIDSNIVKNYLQDIPPISLTGMMYVVSGIPGLALLFMTGYFQDFSADPIARQSTIYIIILGVVGSAFALALFNILLKRTDVVFASMVTYTMPLVAIGWGLLDGERIGLGADRRYCVDLVRGLPGQSEIGLTSPRKMLLTDIPVILLSSHSR